MLALAAMLAGCGGSGSSENGLEHKTPTQIVAAARAAALGAATVHVAGSILNSGKPISLDMEFVSNKGGQGHVVTNGRRVELINVNGFVYVNGSPGFDEGLLGRPAARLLDGRWLKGSATGEAFAPLASLTDMGEVLGSTLADHGSLSHAATTTIQGRRAVAVTDRARGATLYVAATGEPYPLELVERGSRSGKLVFDRWNQPVTLTPPAEAINIKQLQRNG